MICLLDFKLKWVVAGGRGGRGTSGYLLEEFCKSLVSVNDTLDFVTEYFLGCKGGISEVWLWLEFYYSKIGHYNVPLHTIDVGSKRQSLIQLILIHAIVITHKFVRMIWPFWVNELNYLYFCWWFCHPRKMS